VQYCLLDGSATATTPTLLSEQTQDILMSEEEEELAWHTVAHHTTPLTNASTSGKLVLALFGSEWL
jgi:hypothetical protein